MDDSLLAQVLRESREAALQYVRKELSQGRLGDIICASEQVESAEEDTGVRALQIAQGKFSFRCIRAVVAHESWVTAISIGKDAVTNTQILLTGDARGCLIVWKLDTIERLRTFTDQHGLISGIAALPNGQVLTSSADHSIRLRNLRTNSVASTFIGCTRAVNSIALSPSSLRLAAGSGDSVLRVWDIRRPARPAFVFKDHLRAITCVTWIQTPSEEYLVSGGDDGRLVLYTMSSSAARTQTRTLHAKGIRCLISLQDAPGILWSFDALSARSWRVDPAVHELILEHEWTMEEFLADVDGEAHEMKGTPSVLAGTSTLIDGQPVGAIALSTGQIQFFSLVTGERLCSIYCHQAVKKSEMTGTASDDSVSALMLCDEGRLLFTGHHDSTVRVWKSDVKKSTV